MKALVSPEQKPGASCPTHHGTALILLSTDSPGAVVCVLLVQVFAGRVAVESWMNEGTTLDVYWPFLSAFHTSHYCLTFCCIVVIPGVFMESLYIG